ncbi:MAG: hypothetical protein JWN35_2233 [Frankiales bacterium]|jgi:hypothetical protein|nr:hypothetical protein [Frankiales bacterium]
MPTPVAIPGERRPAEGIVAWSQRSDPVLLLAPKDPHVEDRGRSSAICGVVS